MATTNSTMANATTALAPPYPADTISNFMLHTSAAAYQLYVLPIMFILGVLGNGFTCVSIVARKLYTKSTIFIFIGFISALDFVYVWFSSGPELMETFFGVNLINDTSCQARIMVTKLTNVSSVWILVVCSAVKFYGIAYPLKAMQRDTKRFAVIACVSIMIIVVCVYSSLAAYCRYIPAAFVTINGTATLLYECTFFIDSTTTYNIIIGAIAAAYVIVPGIVLFVLSIAILFSFLRSYRQHKRLTQQESTSDSESKPKVKPDTFSTARNAVVILIPMSLIHIIVSLPVFIILMETAYILATLPSDPVPSLMAYYISLHLMDLNHSLNVYVQISVSKFYRLHFMDMNHSLNVYVQISVSKFYRQSLFGIDPGKK